MQISESWKDNMIDTQADATKADAKPTDVCGVHRVGGDTMFVTCCPGASKVQIAGDFNNWKPGRNPMKKVGDKGVWQLTLRLRPGTYRYRLVVDGKWQHDLYNKSTEPNPYGELNSVLTVK